ncbi:extracellular solute-binding protein [Gordonia humi]|uniref:Multiple sugar transport system substrate-binding protein n=1 Tax=Gordonia humi TaxID=686429 RepID=A0A840F6B5_9ACTN|nr:extracellular solute-binding protein [Gordonia humi]MBB4135770.1 multiple sugar transport system substrate-binding protein [Gordonia humi]
MSIACVAAAAVTAPMLTACGSDYDAGVINMYAAADGFDFITEVAQRCTTDSNGEYSIKVNMLPKEADMQRLQLARRLAGNDAGLDLMAMDVVWTAEFADAGWAVPVPDDIATRTRDTNLAGPLETVEWKRSDDAEKRLYAIPLWANTQMLWYRPELMNDKLDTTKAPTTWQGMLDDAAAIKDAGGPGAILLQAKQYEGLMVWFNSLLQSAGGQVLDPNDPTKVTLTDTPEHRKATIEALTVMRQVATAPGADPSISNSDEGTARTDMEAGKGAFEINWPFVFAGIKENGAAGDAKITGDALTGFKDVIDATADDPTDPRVATVNDATRKLFDFAAYPGITSGKTAKSTPGGFNVAVASTSKQQDLAFKAASCLTDEQAQKVYAVRGGTPPTIASLYDDADFQLAYPMYKIIRRQLDEGAAPRPATPRYQDMSTAITATLSPVGQWDPERKADELQKVAQGAIDGEGIVP